MPLRLDPIDEYLHELGPEPNFNESMYFNFYDPSQTLGGFCRLANRANEGKGEMTVCLYLPDGRVGFMFQRPEIADNASFDAGGMAFGVKEPFEHLTIRYQGKVVLLDDPLAMAEPRQAFTENPYEECLLELDYLGVGTPFGGEPTEQHERPGEEFAKGHYEQLGKAVGTVKVGSTEWPITGFGLRDHSWGPRYWQAPWYYRWLTGNVGADFGFMGSRIARKERDGTRGGFVWDGEALHLCDDFAMSTEWQGDDTYHQTISAELRSGDRSWKLSGRVLNLIPLRNRREGMVTRISEGMTEWTLEDGRVGYGLSEYLDQIIDDQPVGIDEEPTPARRGSGGTRARRRLDAERSPLKRALGVEATGERGGSRSGGGDRLAAATPIGARSAPSAFVVLVGRDQLARGNDDQLARSGIVVADGSP